MSLEERFSDLIREYKDCLTNNKLLEGYMKDVFYDEPRLVKIMVYLYNQGIIVDIDRKDILDDSLVNRHLNRLINEQGIDKKYGLEAIKIWVLGYGKDVMSKTINVSFWDSEKQSIKLENLYNNGEISLRTLNCLKRMNMDTLNDVSSFPFSPDFLQSRFGRVTSKNIYDVLKKYDLELRKCSENMAAEDYDQADIKLLGLRQGVEARVRRAGICKIGKLLKLSRDDFMKR